MKSSQSWCISNTLLRCEVGYAGHSCKFMIKRRNLRKSLPWRGLVKKSPTISSVGQYSTERSPLWMRSVIKWDLQMICLVRLMPYKARLTKTAFCAIVPAGLSGGWYSEDNCSLLVWVSCSMTLMRSSVNTGTIAYICIILPKYEVGA